MIARAPRRTAWPPRARRRPRPAVLLAVAALLNAGAGIALGIAVTPDDDAAPAPARVPAAPQVVGAGDLRLPLPAGWRRLEPPPEVPGLTARDPGAARGPAVDVAFAMLSPEHPSLLPDALVAAHGDPLPEPSPARIDGREALRYEGLLRRRTDVYVVPTGDGVATLACVASSSGALAAGCDAVTSALRVGAAPPVPADERAAFAIALPTAVADLNRARAAGRRALAREDGAAGRARVARRLGDAYGTALRRMEPLAGDAAATTEVSGLLADLRREHATLAAASGRRDAVAARRAGERIRAAEARLARVLRRWRGPSDAA